jgi:hypothetical protein
LLRVLARVGLAELQALVAVGRPQLGLERREPAVGDARCGAPRGGWGPAAEQDRRRRIGSRRDPAAPALPQEGLARPGQPQERDGLADRLPAVLEAPAEHLELARPVAAADAEDQPAVRRELRHRGVLGELDRVVERREHDRGAEPDPLRARAHRAREDERRRVVAVRGAVVLAEPHAIEAEPSAQATGRAAHKLARRGPEGGGAHVGLITSSTRLLQAGRSSSRQPVRRI